MIVKVMKNTKTAVLAIMGALALLVSCREKDKTGKGAGKKTEAETAAQPDVTSEEESEPDYGEWFMAQTDYAPVKSVVATSELVEAQFEGRYLYPPINILDGDFDSTWCEADENGSGIGESLTVEFAEPVSFDEIQIVNGFASKDYYEKNNRVKSITLTQTATKMEVKDWDSEKSQYNVETKNHFQQKVYFLEDGIPDWQPIKFELPQTAQTITIKINDIYKGEKYDDTCLDDIRLLYKGKVIPFTNITELKSLQEENSKQMLSEKSDESFRKQFRDLFRGSDVIYLVGDDPNDFKTILDYGKDEDGNDEYLFRPGSSDLVEVGDSQSALYAEIEKSQYADMYLNKEEKKFFKDFEEFPKTKYALLGWKWSSYTRTKYTLGNHRILKTESIAYVETTTAIIAKIEGNTIYLNGTKYKVLSGKDVSDWRYWDGP